ncbi:MAG: sulfatase-like hydrolase/transferase [Verrucomicrobia bacterium]|nr:sulfatase-like hydrolase/transferase [Verrucomicrobiota bacterium]
MEQCPGKRDWIGHFLAWLGGGLIVLTPFFGSWVIRIGTFQVPARLWPGNFIICLMAGGTLLTIGTLLGGGWWTAAGGRNHRHGIWIATGLTAFGAAGWAGWLPQAVHWIGLAALLALLAVAGIRTLVRRRKSGVRMADIPPMPFNGVLFVLILLLCVASDSMVLAKLEASRTAVATFVVVRVLTQLSLVSLAWWAVHLFVRWSPRGTRWLAGVMLGTALLGLLAEIGMNQLWGKGLTLFFGEFAAGDKFDLVRIMEGGNVKLGVAGGFGIVGALLAVVGFYHATKWLSAKVHLRLQPRALFMLSLGAWMALMLEQSTERFWNDRAGHWLQRRALMLHLCPYLSEPGWATFQVTFREQVRPTGAGATRKPDVHLLIIETLRADAIRPEIAPFLCRWRETECQPIGRTHSCANATHLSWFSILSGYPSVFWDRCRQAQRPAPLLESLHANGYRNEVRSAAIFDYVEMDTTNFGHGEATEEMVTVRVHPEAWPPHCSDRDLRVRDLWQQSVVSRPSGGTCRVMAIESPHYPFYWPASFKPPHPDFFTSMVFPFKPSQENIRLIRNRYENSVAFVDHLVEGYIAFLKANDRYDNAMIVVTGDHGEELQERGFWFHASALTREQTEVPIFVKWPKEMGRGEPVDQASHLDIVPSILDAIGCPPSQWEGLAGRSLRQTGERSVLLTTHYASQNGEGMHWRRGGYEAAFSWHKIWVPGIPERMWLDRMTGPGGPLRFETPQQAEAALREHFPDAFGRWFTRFELEPEEK